MLNIFLISRMPRALVLDVTHSQPLVDEGLASLAHQFPLG